MNSPTSSSSASPPHAAKTIVDTAAASPRASTSTERGLDAFLARAELAKVTRALRARLSYASYKATNNVAHVPLQALEQQQEANAPRSSSMSFSAGTPLANSPRRRLMMPPPAAPPSLYSSLISKDSQTASSVTIHSKKDRSPLSSPAHKRARHDSPVTKHASSRASPSSKPSSTRATSPSPSRASSSRRKKARASSPSPSGSRSTRAGRAAAGRGSGSADVEMVDASQGSTGTTTDLEDLTAAAVLTSLLHNSTANNSSGSATSGTSRPHSPTPSHASSYTTDHYAPSSISATSVPRQERAPSLGIISPRGSFSMPSSQASSSKGEVGSKSASTSVTDAENAAEMMLYLATSPSPARPTVRRPDQRILTRNSGRVLFPSSSTDEGGGEPPGVGVAGPSRQVAYSMYARPSDIGVGGEYSHARTKTAPESIYAGDLLPGVGPIPSSRPSTSSSQHSSPRSAGTVQGAEDSQSLSGFADSQETRVDRDEMQYSPGDVKGKGRQSSYDAEVAAMRMSSPMSIDPQPKTSAISKTPPSWGGYLDASMSTIVTPSEYAGRMGTSDVRGAGLEPEGSPLDESPNIPPGPVSLQQRSVML